jgi:VanZ family protein
MSDRGPGPDSRPAGRPLIRTLLATAIMFAGFAALSFLYDPYHEHPDRRLESTGFEPSGEADPPLDERDEWTLVHPRVSWVADGGFEGSAGIRLTAREGRGAWIERSIEDPQRYRSLRVRARLRLQDYVPREQGYSGARWVLFFRNAQDEPMWSQPHVVCLERDARGGDWIHCQGTFDVPPPAVSGHVRAQIVAERGTLLVDDLEILPASPKRSRLAWASLLALLWGLAVWQALAWLRPWRHPLGVPQLALAAVIVFGTVCPTWLLQDAVSLVRETGREIERRWTADPVPSESQDRADGPKATRKPREGPSEPAAPEPSASPPRAGKEARPDEPAAAPGPLGRALGQLVEALREAVSGASMVTVAKRSGHAALFFVLGLLTFVGIWQRGEAARPGPWVQKLIVLAVFAAATEALQVVTPSREPAVRDWLLDLAGVAAALLISLPLSLAARRRARASRSGASE